MLRTDKEFVAWKGFPVVVTTTQPHKKKTKFEGNLVRRDDEFVHLNLKGRPIKVCPLSAACPGPRCTRPGAPPPPARSSLCHACREVGSAGSRGLPEPCRVSRIARALALGRGGVPHSAPCHIQHSPNTPTTGLRERGNDTSKSTGRSGRQKVATRRNMRREKRVTVQGPVKEQQPDGMSHRGCHPRPARSAPCTRATHGVAERKDDGAATVQRKSPGTPRRRIRHPRQP